MAFDGIITLVMANELNNELKAGKIEKVYQPEKDELVLNIHTREGNKKLYMSVNSNNSRINLINSNPSNPPSPLSFCMLLRKHLQGGRISSIEQIGCERIIEISIETVNELKFSVSKKLIVEIMGKHSNIVLVDVESGKIIDSIKRVSIDVNRIRQILPGKIYTYPPAQDKTSFKNVSESDLPTQELDGKGMLELVGGISPALARELALKQNPWQFLNSLIHIAEKGEYISRVYIDIDNIPREFYITDLTEYNNSCEMITFENINDAINYFFDNRDSSNRAKQKSNDLIKSTIAHLEKLYLKKQRLGEDILRATNSEELRLFGELLTANLHLVKPGSETVDVIDYYSENKITIPIDKRYSASKNAQNYFKKYGKMKTAIKEKQLQITECQEEINYLESVLTFLNNTDNVSDVDALRDELTETGYIKKKKSNFKEKKYKPQPYHYESSDGFQILVGRNNKENDILTTKTADKNDYWLHTKDIPGSHVVIKSDGRDISDTAILEAAAIAAYHSKGRNSENVPVDYVLARYVKKPAGAKPGMVIFTNNYTTWINPKLPNNREQ